MISLVLNDYRKTWAQGLASYSGFSRQEETAILDLFDSFIASAELPFERQNIHGHFTASAIITNPSFDHVLLTHHRKLEKWLQLGGHADGDRNLEAVAMKEANEESGLTKLTLLDMRSIFRNQFSDWQGPYLPLDLDRHLIPERANEPAHFHYDVRFLIVADAKERVAVSAESYDVKWFILEEAYQISKERSMFRQLDKLRFIGEQETTD